MARATRLLRLFAIVLLSAAIVTFGGAIAQTNVGDGLIALALVLATVTCWRLARIVDTQLRDSQAWSEVASIAALLDTHRAGWAALPTPAAVWNADGQLLMATDAWRQLGLPSDTQPTTAEVTVPHGSRVFTVERATSADLHVAMLREVTRERQALQAKDELLAVVGHELRTPLSSIKGYGQLMSRQLATVQEQVQRLDQLIADVLDTARHDTGRLNLARKPLSVEHLVASASDRFRVAHPSRHVEVQVDRDAFIEGDEARLSQVLDNLLSNAAKYSPPESPITVFAQVDGASAKIAVRDHGVGIAAEHLPHLFERFYRVTSQGEAPSGFGLGLSIVRDLVEAHGGNVEVFSNGPGKGCTFTVVLPVTLPLARSATA